MRLFVTQGELNKHILSFDNIHDHATYGLDINDPTLIDITQLGVDLALLWEQKKIILLKIKGILRQPDIPHKSSVT